MSLEVFCYGRGASSCNASGKTHTIMIVSLLQLYCIGILVVVLSVCVVCLLFRLNHSFVKRFVLLASSNDAI